MLSSRKAEEKLFREDAYAPKRAKRWELRDDDEDEQPDEPDNNTNLGGKRGDRRLKKEAEAEVEGGDEDTDDDEGDLAFYEDLGNEEGVPKKEEEDEGDEEPTEAGAQTKAQPRKGRKGKKAQRVIGQADAQMKSLETAVFGHGDEAMKHVADIQLQTETRAGSFVEDRKPVWTDADDADVRVDITSQARLRKLRDNTQESVVSGTSLEGKLRQQFEKLHGRPAWADENRRAAALEESGDVDGEDTALLRSTKSLLASSRQRLIRGVIDISRMKDGNCSKRNDAVVQCVDFHPAAPALLTAGLDKTLRIFQVDGRKNRLMSSTFIRNLPIHSAAFSPDGTEVVMSGRRPFFYTFDLESGSVIRTKQIAGRKEKSLERMWMSPDNQFITFTGRDGHMLLVSRKTKQLVGTLKMNQSCRQAAFSRDSRYLFTTGDEGHVYVWDMNTRDCVNVFEDEGSQCGTAIAVGPDGKTIAVGSDAGVVNVYDESCFSTRRPKPRKSLFNLTTTIDNLHFNHDGNVLCMSSRMKRNALRLVHMPSLTVFHNWPTQSTALRFIHTAAFSPNSAFMALGNDKGRVPLFRLNHYQGY